MVTRIIALLEHPEQVGELTQCLVEQAGYDLEIATSFTQAQVALKKRAFDMIISDVHLENGGSVFDFLKWVKSNFQLRKIPFVFLSLRPTEPAKYLSDGVRTAARALGAAKYVSMDVFDPALLLDQIAELLPAGAAREAVVTKEGK